MREYRLIDADCHVVEPPHIWERWLPKQFEDRAPRLVKDEEGGDAWEFVPGGPLMYIGLVATPGMRFEDIKWKGYTYDTVRRVSKSTSTSEPPQPPQLQVRPRRA